MSESPKSPRSPLHEDRGSPMNSTTDTPAIAPASGASSAAASGTGGSLFVGRLAFDCRPRELEDLFGKYGRITRCDIKRGKISGHSAAEYFTNFFIILYHPQDLLSLSLRMKETPLMPSNTWTAPNFWD